MLEGMIALIEGSFIDEDKHNPKEEYGVRIARQIIALHIIEILFKIKHENDNIKYKKITHNIEYLFQKLLPESREKIKENYIRLMKHHCKRAMKFCKSVPDLVKHLKENDITDIRYVWNVDEKHKEGDITIILDDLMNLIFAIRIVLYDFDYESKYGPIEDRYDTVFLSVSDLEDDERSYHIVKSIS